MKGNRVYRALKPRWGTFAVKIVLSSVGFLTVAVIIFAALWEYWDAERYGDMAGTGAVSIILYGIIMHIVVKSLKNEKRTLDRQKDLLASLDSYTLESLEEEVQSSEPYFKCFYLLDEYLFVPKAALLIKYGEIKSYKTVFHYTNGLEDAAFAEIFDKDGIRYYFSVNRWRDYKKKYYGFMELLEEKGVFNGTNTSDNDIIA
ncbi:MAG: hypothetical protein NC120_00630 [Ruminococcus sp.]|nr:hypothetical protein [Ruminococcus sp.]